MIPLWQTWAAEASGHILAPWAAGGQVQGTNLARQNSRTKRKLLCAYTMSHPEPSSTARLLLLLFPELSVQMGCGCDNRDHGKEGKKNRNSQVSSTCYYTHQTLLIRQQQNFINRTDIIEWACYKWALSGPYSATKWVFAVQCAHLRHQASCWITNDCY